MSLGLLTVAVAASVGIVLAADRQPYGSDGATFVDGTAEISETTTLYDLREQYLRVAGDPSLTNNKDLENEYPEAWVVNGDGQLAARDSDDGDGAVGQRNCQVSKTKPMKPRSLSFCHKFNDLACCLPQLDDENNEFFGDMTNLGLSCRIRGDIRKDPLAKFYCLNCDPNQPRYIRPAQSINGSALAGGGGVSYELNEDDQNILMISRSWAENEFGVNPILAGPDDRLQNCGLLVSSPCQGFNNGASEDIDNRDRYTCGDDLVIPPNDHKVLDANGNVDTDASFMTFLNTPSLGTPFVDEMFFFGLVKDETCTDAEADSVFPDCRRTAQQMTSLNITSQAPSDINTFQDMVCTTDCKAVRCTTQMLVEGTVEEKCCCYPWFDEMVFSGASGLAPTSAFVTAVVMVVVSLLW
eukprot:m.214758 g.214758  ORF g.214758 m.214758 type:complete len:411 (+) comp19079_c0_seq1:174-1406(+)